MYKVKSILDREEFNNIIIYELREIGVKYKEKKTKAYPEYLHQKNIFHTHLHLLELTDVILLNGSAVQIPKFVADACNRVLENVEIEGIFRKAGSALRQKELRRNLEAGLPINKSDHVIDVANVIKYFFRELPEPLIPLSIQEALLRCLLLEENNLRAILLICLLMPQLTLNTLSFFMQFLKTVSCNSDLNKMTAGNLAIVLAPGLMPFPDINNHKFNNHVKVLQLLIENAELIGSIPAFLVDKLKSSETLDFYSPSKVYKYHESSQKKKKKRKSEMFSGLRKIVGAALGSSETLDKTPEKKNTIKDSTNENNPQYQFIRIMDSNQSVNTPCIKVPKKRKFVDPVSAFGAKKKKDFLTLLPINNGSLLASTPITKEMKKSRQSLGVSRQIKCNAGIPGVNSMERRWSIVGTGWHRLKNRNVPDQISPGSHESIEFQTKTEKNELNENIIGNNNIFFKNSMNGITESQKTDEKILNVQNMNDNYNRESQQEYDAIKERVEAIEHRISKELQKLRDSLSSKPELSNEEDNCANSVERVQSTYERVIVETEMLSSPNTELLAKQFSRDLKIRRSADIKILRSPSARKIGTIRKRSHVRNRLCRHQTWHISSNKTNSQKNGSVYPFDNYIEHTSKRVIETDNSKPQELSNLEFSNFHHSSVLETKFDTNFNNEEWTSADIFFNLTPQKVLKKNLKLDVKVVDNTPKEIKCTPVRTMQTKIENTPSNCNLHTPMLPPKSIPKRTTHRTPSSNFGIIASAVSGILPNKLLMPTPFEEDGNGRASIARLRTQNAGMVMAKAKLFDGMGNTSGDNTQLPPNSATETMCKVEGLKKNYVHHIPKPIRKNNESFNNGDLTVPISNKRKYNTKIANSDSLKQTNSRIESNIAKSPAITKPGINITKKQSSINTLKPSEIASQKCNNTMSSLTQLSKNRKLKDIKKCTLSPRSTKIHISNHNSPKSFRTTNIINQKCSPISRYRKPSCIQKLKIDR